MGTRFMLIFCIIILAMCEYDQFVVGGRGGGRSRGSSHRSSSHRASHSHSNSGGHFWSGWFNWGGSSGGGGSGVGAATAKKSPALSHRNSGGNHPTSHAGFSQYGKDYEANFHNVHSQRQYTPVPHPYQRHFHPQTTDVFAYHFIPQMHTHHHVHYYTTASRTEPMYYDYNSSVLLPTSEKAPIIYDYKPPNPMDLSSDEIEINLQSNTHPNDILISGVENMLLYGNLKDNQHQIIFVQQASDGITLENELLMAFDNFGASENVLPQYFPDVEFRFDADDEPNDDDLQNIYGMYKDLVDHGRC